MYRLSLKTAIIVLLILATYHAQAQSLNNTLPNIKIRKNTTNGTEQTFTVQDAVKLVRFFMAQEGIERCETDLYNRKLKLIARSGIDLNEMLQKNALNDKIIAMGYTIDIPKPQPALANINNTTKTTDNIPSTKTSMDKKALLEKAKAAASAKANNANPNTLKPTMPNVVSAKPDCTDCGEVKIDNSFKESILKDANYGGTEILIDMPMGNYESNSPTNNKTNPIPNTPTINTTQLDSLRQILFKKQPK